WEKLSAATDNHTAFADTPRRSGQRPALQRKSKPAAAPIAGKHPPWWVFALAAGLAVVAVVVVLSIAFALGLFGRTAATATTQPAAPSALVVNSNGKDTPYRRVADALAKVKPGQKIVVQDEAVEETLWVDEKEGHERFTDVTIEPEGERAIVWRFPKGVPAGEPFVRLSGLVGFRLRKIAFDGDKRGQNLVNIFRRCPGLTLAELRFQGC